MSALEKDLNPDTFIGLSFPIRRDNNNDFKLTKTSLEQAQHNLKNLFLTYPGERVGQPTFGSRIRELCFEQIDDELPASIEEEVRRTVSNWLPYIKVFNHIKSRYLRINNNRRVVHGYCILGVIKWHVHQ